MIKKSFTIQLDGEVTLARFYRALEAWNETLEAISGEIAFEGSHAILIDDLSYGSAIATVGIGFEKQILASQFESSFATVGQHVRNDSVHELPEPLQRPARRLQEAARMEGVAGFTLASEESDFLIDPVRWANAPDQLMETPPAVSMAVNKVEAFGVVTGRLQSLNSRGTLKVTIYDELNDKGVRVTLTEAQREVVRDLWDKTVVVEGLVRRDPESGRPLSITRVRDIRKKEAPGDPFAWRKARGVLSHIHPEKSSEQLIREARNA